MANVENLLAISSESLAPKPSMFPEFLRAYTLGAELFHMLEQKNGFYAFEFALHVFPLTSSPEAGLVFFAEDALQDQFCLSSKENGVFRFRAETGRTVFMADSIERWAGVILSDSSTETSWPFAHEWQLKNGPLPLGKRLMPKIPFFLGGEFNIENFWAGNPLEGMRFKGDLAMQTRDVPDGAQVRLNVGPKPE